jgi:putative membrane protein
VTFVLGEFFPEFLLFALLPIAFWVGVIVVIVRLLNSRDANARRRSPALELLAERYARGEITRDEFVERREVLKGDRV